MSETSFLAVATVAVAATSTTTRTLTHAIVPFHESQIPKLRDSLKIWWNAFPPCDLTNNGSPFSHPCPDLVFHISFSGNNATSQQFIAAVHQVYTASLPQLIIKTYFCWTYAIPQKLSNEANNHLSGSCFMMEFMLCGNLVNSKNEDHQAPHYVLYMEPDTIPIQKNWLLTLQNEVAHASRSKFWMMGTLFRGSYPKNCNIKDIWIQYHINGNVIYNLQPNAFPKFYFYFMIPYIKSLHPQGDVDATGNYYLFPYLYLSDMNNTAVMQEVWHKFRYTDIIQNWSRTPWLLPEFQAMYPSTLLVHGGTPLYVPNATASLLQ